MSRASRLLLPLASLVLATVGRASGAEPDRPHEAAGGRHCMGEARSKLLLSNGLYAQTNPLGLQDQLEYAGCLPLVRRPGPLFAYTNLQAGLVVNATPVYVTPGAFVSAAPLSVLELRAEAAAVRAWSIGSDGSGYFPRSGPDEQFQRLPGALARSAKGATATLTATLRARFELLRSWSIVAVDSYAHAYWRLGDAPWYYNPRHDLVMARRDWVGRNTAALLLERELSERLTVRAGATDELTWLPRSGYRANILAGLFSAQLSRWPGAWGETQAFVRIGAYTEHAFRTGQLQTLAGIAVTFDVTPGHHLR